MSLNIFFFTDGSLGWDKIVWQVFNSAIQCLEKQLETKAFHRGGSSQLFGAKAELEHRGAESR